MIYRVTKMFPDGTQKNEVVQGKPEYDAFHRQMELGDIMAFVVSPKKD